MKEQIRRILEDSQLNFIFDKDKGKISLRKEDTAYISRWNEYIENGFSLLYTGGEGSKVYKCVLDPVPLFFLRCLGLRNNNFLKQSENELLSNDRALRIEYLEESNILWIGRFSTWGWVGYCGKGLTASVVEYGPNENRFAFINEKVSSNFHSELENYYQSTASSAKREYVSKEMFEKRKNILYDLWGINPI